MRIYLFRLSGSTFILAIIDMSLMLLENLHQYFLNTFFTVLLINRNFVLMIADNFETFEIQRHHFKNSYIYLIFNNFDHERK
jgi:hypothetical protein